MRMGIRAKLVSTLLLAGLLPLALALGIILLGFVELRVVSKGQTYRALAQERAAHLASILSAQVELMELINGLPGCVEIIDVSNSRPQLTPEQIHQIESGWPGLRENQDLVREILSNALSIRWQSVKERERRFAEVMVTDASGRLVAASNKTSDYFQADEDWWQECFAGGRGKVTISNIIFDESATLSDGQSGVLVTNLCVPITTGIGADRRVIGIAKASLHAQWLQAQLEVPQVAGDVPRAVWLVSDDGRALPGAASPAPAEILPSPLAQRLRARNRGWDIEEQMPGYELVGFAAMQRSHLIDAHQQQWHVVVAGSRAQVLAPVYRLVWIILLLGLGVIVACFVGGLFIARRYLVRPIVLLEDAVEQIKAGRRDYRLSEARGPGHDFRDDELGVLAHDFNVMAAQLQSSFQRLEEADSLKRQFIDLASHELRTPVTYILCAVQLAQRQGPNGDGHEEILPRIAAKAHRLGRIVENMFKLMASEHYEGKLRPGDVDLRAMIQSVCQEHEPFLRERRQIWELDLDDSPSMLQADPDKLRDILENLVSNAIRFSPDGGKVGVHVHRDGANVIIEISDSGPGIAPVDLPRLFQPFFTGAGLRQSSGDYQFMSRGMGLGLSVVKRFIDLHGGTVYVDTSSGGTTIRVSLPVTLLKPSTTATVAS